MRQVLKYADAKAASGSVLVCVVLICGAMFGMATQAGLLHIGLDFGSVRDDLIVGAIARPRSALAWWAWWLLPLGAFFVGPLSVAFTRCVMANLWRLRAVRVIASAGAVLGLAALGKLPAASSTFDVRSGAAASLIVVSLSALLAWLGASILGSFRQETARAPAFTREGGRASALRPEQIRFRMLSPVQPPPPWRGGGSAAAGAPFPRIRHALISRFTVGHLALVALLTIFVFAAVGSVSGVTVLVEHATPRAIQLLVAQSGLRPSDPTPAEQAIGMVAAEASPAEVAQPEPQGMVIDGVLIPESELTFARGYVKRQAVLAAKRASVKIVAAAEKAEAKLPAQLKHVAALRPVQYGHPHHVVHVRHLERHIKRHVDGHHVESHRADSHHVERHYRVHKRYTLERHHPAPRHPYRLHDRRPHGHDHYASEPGYRMAQF
ncbi:MAG TPA: hypothetical protein VGG01_20935 [Xanthobacteraceae bacterium]|jgi:hypothetical protein